MADGRRRRREGTGSASALFPDAKVYAWSLTSYSGLLVFSMRGTGGGTSRIGAAVKLAAQIYVRTYCNGFAARAR